MTISVKLEFSFDTPDEAVRLLSMLQAAEEFSTGDEHGPRSAHEERIQRSELQAKPIMDMIATELAKKGLKPTRLQDDLHVLSAGRSPELQD